MTEETAQFIELFDQVNSVEDAIRELNALKKEKFDLFAERTGISVKALKKAHAAYKEYLKSEAEFHTIDGETDHILNAVIGKRDMEAA